MTFEAHDVLSVEVKGEAMSVNEADYSCVIWCTAGPEERQQRRWVGVVMRRWSCPAHTGNKVSFCMGGVTELTAVKELCAFPPFGSCVVFVGLFVGFRWTSGRQLTAGW